MILAIVVILLCVGISPGIVLLIKEGKAIHETKREMQQNRQEIEELRKKL